MNGFASFCARTLVAASVLGAWVAGPASAQQHDTQRPVTIADIDQAIDGQKLVQCMLSKSFGGFGRIMPLVISDADGALKLLSSEALTASSTSAGDIAFSTSRPFELGFLRMTGDTITVEITTSEGMISGNCTDLTDITALALPAWFPHIEQSLIKVRSAEWLEEKEDLLEKIERLKSQVAALEDKISALTEGDINFEVMYVIGPNRFAVQLRQLDPVNGRVVKIREHKIDDGNFPDEYQDIVDDPDTRFKIWLTSGVSSWNVVDRLNTIDALSGRITEIPREGYIAPGTYDIPRGENRAVLLDDMVATQLSDLHELWETRQNGLALKNPEEALILASIIEKETGAFRERFLISSVFNNRLKNGMRLQSDPATIYGITQGQRFLGRELTFDELREPSPWNTHVIDGLPETPITNPSRGAIQAALNPADADYIFFVAKSLDPRDGHRFAVTLAQHNENVVKYREIADAYLKSTDTMEGSTGSQSGTLNVDLWETYYLAELLEEIKQCWVVDSGSKAAVQSVTLTFDMELSGRVIGSSLRLADSAPGDETAIEEAFQAARRAVLRCQGDGYALPGNLYEHWKTLKIEFDGKGVALRETQ